MFEHRFYLTEPSEGSGGSLRAKNGKGKTVKPRKRGRQKRRSIWTGCSGNGEKKLQTKY